MKIVEIFIRFMASSINLKNICQSELPAIRIFLDLQIPLILNSYCNSFQFSKNKMTFVAKQMYDNIDEFNIESLIILVVSCSIHSQLQK